MSWKIPKRPNDWKKTCRLGGGFGYCLFLPLPGEMIQFDPIWLMFFNWVEATNLSSILWQFCVTRFWRSQQQPDSPKFFLNVYGAWTPHFPWRSKGVNPVSFWGEIGFTGQKWWPNRLRSSSSYAYLTGLDILIFQSNIPSILERKTYSEIFWRYILVLFSYAL